MRITLKEMGEWMTRLHHEHRQQRRHILMSVKSKIIFDSYFMLRETKIKFFWTDTPKAIDHAELTPYNKGNLWKIRCFYDGSCRVYYGTIKKAWCTTIIDAINFINKQ